MSMTSFGRFFVYMLASRKYGPIYTGVTGDLPVRVYIHREALIPGFSSRYKTYRLVWFEQHDDPSEAILREKRIKKWYRDWKIELIEKTNPGWDDLYDSLFEQLKQTGSFDHHRVIPTKAGISVSRVAVIRTRAATQPTEIPAFAGMTRWGDGEVVDRHSSFTIPPCDIPPVSLRPHTQKARISATLRPS